MLDGSAVCNTVVLFKDACLIRHDGNTKGEKTTSLEKKHDILWDTN
jgi:hypothetical protein